MTFGLPKASKLLSWISGTVVALFSLYKWLNQSGQLAEALFTFVISCFALFQLLRPYRARLILDKDHLSYCDGYVSMHSLKLKDLDFIKIYRPTKLAVHAKDGNAFAVDYVFENIEGFYEQAKKLKIRLDMSEAQKAKQI